MQLEKHIVEYKDFPKEGVLFKDINPLLKDFKLRKELISQLVSLCKEDKIKIDTIFAIEARGFSIGALLAQELNCEFVPLRKKGKLPGYCISQTYLKEYGEDTLEVQHGFYGNILIVDDILATGGTAVAAKTLAFLTGNPIGCLFVGNIESLKGRVLLNQLNISCKYLFEL